MILFLRNFVVCQIAISLMRGFISWRGFIHCHMLLTRYLYMYMYMYRIEIYRTVDCVLETSVHWYHSKIIHHDITKDEKDGCKERSWLKKMMWRKIRWKKGEEREEDERREGEVQRKGMEFTAYPQGCPPGLPGAAWVGYSESYRHPPAGTPVGSRCPYSLPPVSKCHRGNTL